MKKLWLLILILVGSLTVNAQDTIPVIEKTDHGYSYDWYHLHIDKDTITKRYQVYHFYNKKMWVSINGNLAVKLPKRAGLTIFELKPLIITVSRKNYKRIYSI